MLNYIWLGLVVLAVVIGGMNGQLKEVADKSFEMAEYAVMKTALPLVGIMALWLGIMRLAERAGLVTLLARALRPLMHRLFPEVPPEHPAIGSMVMNMSANMLGLGNAATPMGLRAMKELESLNRIPGTATNAMCTFLALNTSGMQIIPVTAIAILAANKSSNPTAIVGTAVIATACAATAGVTMAKVLEKLPGFRLAPVSVSKSAGSHSRLQQPNSSGGVDSEESTATRNRIASEDVPATVKAAAAGRPMPAWGGVLFSAFFLFFVALFVRLAFPEVWHVVAEAVHRGWAAVFGASVPPSMPEAILNQPAQPGAFVRVVDSISKLSIPFLLAGIPLYAALRGVKVYEEFVEGAKEGFDVALRIIPYLIAILVAIGMFRAAGGIDLLSRGLSPLMQALGFPSELLPMVLMRPLSGSGTLGLFTELVKQFGPDSFIARLGGTIYGSTETTFYVLAVYFGSVGVKRTRHAVVAGLTADLAGVIASVLICGLVFGK